MGYMTIEIAPQVLEMMTKEELLELMTGVRGWSRTDDGGLKIIVIKSDSTYGGRGSDPHPH